MMGSLNPLSVQSKVKLLRGASQNRIAEAGLFSSVGFGEENQHVLFTYCIAEVSTTQEINKGKAYKDLFDVSFI